MTSSFPPTNIGDKMKKSIVALFAFVIALVAQADVLYWMVSDDFEGKVSASDTSDFVALYVSGDSLTPNPTALATKTGAQVYTALDDGATFAYNGIEAYSTGSLSFYVEILSGDYKGYQTEHMTYAQLANYIRGGGSTIPSSTFDAAGFGGGTTTYNVPEPTSGLLFLVGGMLLGLKRRRQKV